jgi:hypothetical protein
MLSKILPRFYFNRFGTYRIFLYNPYSRFVRLCIEIRHNFGTFFGVFFKMGAFYKVSKQRNRKLG